MSLTQPDGYLALPDAGTGAPVLVLHAWWGLNDTIKAFCDRLANEGFIAFAPDLYHGKVTDQITEAETLSARLFDDLSQPRADVVKAVHYLHNLGDESDSRSAVIGFSLGAFFALDVSASDSGTIDSVVVFYGTGPTDFSQSKAAYLGHFAENDEFEPQSNVDELAQALKQAGRPITFYSYPATGHWFFEPDRPDAYDEAAATLAWERTLEFLKNRVSA